MDGEDLGLSIFLEKCKERREECWLLLGLHILLQLLPGWSNLSTVLCIWSISCNTWINIGILKKKTYVPLEKPLILKNFGRKVGKQAIWKWGLQSMGPLSLICILFADDLLLLWETYYSQPCVMERMLKCFCVELGQKVSVSKSRVWFRGASSP